MCSLRENVQVVAKQVSLTTCHECYGHLGEQNLKFLKQKNLVNINVSLCFKWDTLIML